MKPILSLNDLSVLVVNFVFYFIIAVVGSMVKILYDNFNEEKKKENVSHTRILVSALTTAFLSIGLQELFLHKFSLNTIILLNFIAGVLGFEIFGFISSAKNFKNTIISIIKLKKYMDNQITDDEVKQVLKDNDDDNETKT